jgi:hypothetical protein
MEMMVAITCASVLALAVMQGYSAYRKAYACYVESYWNESMELLRTLHETTKNVRFGGRLENRF